MEKLKQQDCCIDSNMRLVGYWYKNYDTGFATQIIECRTCLRKFNKSGFHNNLTAHLNIIGGTCIYEGNKTKNTSGIDLETGIPSNS